MRHPRLVLVARAPNRWERSRNVAWNQRFHKLRSYRGLMGPARTRCATRPRGQGRRETTKIEIRASRGRVAEARTHRKRRDVCATRGWFGLRGRPTVGNEAGMWPGINGFTNCAPIAD